MKILGALLVTLLCVAAGRGAIAHHSFAAEVDASKAIRVTGSYLNPAPLPPPVPRTDPTKK
jgi:hypothetical protein